MYLSCACVYLVLDLLHTFFSHPYWLLMAEPQPFFLPFFMLRRKKDRSRPRGSNPSTWILDMSILTRENDNAYIIQSYTRIRYFDIRLVCIALCACHLQLCDFRLPLSDLASCLRRRTTVAGVKHFAQFISWRFKYLKLSGDRKDVSDVSAMCERTRCVPYHVWNSITDSQASFTAK